MEQPIKCLLIEDDIDDQEIFKLCLKRVEQNVDCAVANDGVEALQMLKANESYIPEVIFLDVNMPKMNGLECLKHLRDISRLSRTRIYVYSTTSEISVVNKSMEGGAHEYISKPARTVDLKDKLAAIFKTCELIKTPPPKSA